MTRPDLDASASVSRLVAARHSPVASRLCLSGILFCSFAVAGAAQCYAQDQQDQSQQNQSVAEAARQERARKQSHQKKSKHIYTAEDLKREHILTQEDRAQLEARRNQPAPAGEQRPQDAVDGSAVASDTNKQPLPADAPLGDVARRLRQQKESEKLQRSAEFHLPFANAPVLASPKPPVQPLNPPVTVGKPTPPVVPSLRPAVKRSPFERPRILPSPPALAAPRALSPAAPAPYVLPTPSPAVSGKLTIVTVKPGDSLWKFAAARLGNGRRWQELLSLNPGLRDPDLLKVGSQIVVPASLAPPRAPTKYTVRHGDTLWTIAQSHLGHGSSWACIAQANPAIREPNLIHEGLVLLISPTCPH